ncbi:MAG: NfeD family protein [Endomicrobium sp.]|nr:NfeD family protein [Endomicrobium sp.]
MINWFIITILFLIISIIIPYAFFLFYLSIASFVALMLYCHSGISPIIGIFISLISIIILIYIIDILFKKFNLTKSNFLNTNVDILIGEKAIVVKTIVPNAIGFVKIYNELWRASANEIFLINELVIIKKIKGTTLIVSKINEI